MGVELYRFRSVCSRFGASDPKGGSFHWVLSPGAFVFVSDEDALLEATDEELSDHGVSLFFLNFSVRTGVHLSI